MLETNDLTKIFVMGGAQVKAVDKVTLKIEDGEFIAIVGPSGSGKTTLISCLGCIIAPSSGEIIIDKKRVDYKKKGDLARTRRSKIGFIFQTFNLISFLSAEENVMIPLQNLGVKGNYAKKCAQELLEAVGLLERRNHLPSQLSGGERQRVSIARALASEPDIIFADEPTANLDSDRGKEIMTLLESLCRQHRKTLICVTHDQRVAERADRILNMIDGKLA